MVREQMSINKENYPIFNEEFFKERENFFINNYAKKDCVLEKDARILIQGETDFKETLYCSKCGKLYHSLNDNPKNISDFDLKNSNKCCKDINILSTKKYYGKISCNNSVIDSFNSIYISFTEDDAFELARILKIMYFDLDAFKIKYSYKLIGYSFFDLEYNAKNFVIRRNGKLSETKSKKGILYMPSFFSFDNGKKTEDIYIQKFNSYIKGDENYKNSYKILDRYVLLSYVEKEFRYSGGLSKEFIEKINIVSQTNKYHSLEILAKAGFFRLHKDALSGIGYKMPSVIMSRKGTKLKDKIYLTKPLMDLAKHFTEGNILQLEKLEEKYPGIDKDDLYTAIFNYTGISELLTAKERMVVMAEHDYEISKLLSTINELMEHTNSLSKINEYLDDVSMHQAIPYNESIIIWRDYLYVFDLMSKVNNGELIKNKSKYPRSLKLEHDLIVRDYNELKANIDSDKIKKVAEENKELEIESSNYKIIFPKNVMDLKKEGASLSHCVGSYGHRIVSGKSKIAFVRKKDNIDKSLYTIEFNERGILQLEGFGRQKPKDEEILELIDDFQDRISNK